MDVTNRPLEAPCSVPETQKAVTDTEFGKPQIMIQIPGMISSEIANPGDEGLNFWRSAK